MEYIKLYGRNIKEDIAEIKRALNNNIIFIYSGTGTLYDYIDKLYDNGNGLDETDLYKFKICYEKGNLSISYFSIDSKRNRKIHSMSSLINELDKKRDCKIIVESNQRVELAFIVQQLIFIEYPLEKVDILLRKEEHDAEKTRRFMKKVKELLENCTQAILHLSELKVQIENEPDNPTKNIRLEDVNSTLDSCLKIKKQIMKAIRVELKLAVAASKKAGKSVIVNCFLGDEIAPTSTELATPNNCFYKKSPDNKYHLQLENDVEKTFESCKEIHGEINRYFREAQNNQEAGFTLPNMNIGYVTEENNFSSYTIFDTAGPDAAGTHHWNAAKKAMELCDVAVFAIDYSKYLTTSEEKYLKQIKQMFAEQHKFHSLIFALNKIDIRYNDVNSAKSFIMSVDFIKTRLTRIDEAYSDCIIFPTSSLEYFHAIEAEKAGITELNAENNLTVDQLKKVAFAHKDVKSLAWLHHHSENLEYYHELKTISYDVLKKDSGIPALMNYVSYVAQSKARDEIVNNITFQIDSQKMNIQSILDNIRNIEVFIQADNDKIAQISQIITDYTDSVKKILSPKFNENDLAVLDNKHSLLNIFKGDPDALLNHQRAALQPYYDKVRIAEEMYSIAVNEIWEKIDSLSEFDGKKIDNLFTTLKFESTANTIARQRVNVAVQDTRDQLSLFSEEVKKIAEYRQEQIQIESDKCRGCLAKENINITFPVLPAFQFNTAMPAPGKIIVQFREINLKLYDSLSTLFSKKIWENIGTFFSKLFGMASETDYKLKISGTKDDFYRLCEKNLKDRFKNAVYENNISEKLEGYLRKNVIDGYMQNLLSDIQGVFDNMNNTYTLCMERFRSAIDDRDKYKEDIELHTLRKSNITAIGNCTEDFMETWNHIIYDFEQKDQ